MTDVSVGGAYPAEGCGGLWRGCGGLWRAVEGCGGGAVRTPGSKNHVAVEKKVPLSSRKGSDFGAFGVPMARATWAWRKAGVAFGATSSYPRPSRPGTLWACLSGNPLRDPAEAGGMSGAVHRRWEGLLRAAGEGSWAVGGSAGEGSWAVGGSAPRSFSSVLGGGGRPNGHNGEAQDSDRTKMVRQPPPIQKDGSQRVPFPPFPEYSPNGAPPDWRTRCSELFCRMRSPFVCRCSVRCCAGLAHPDQGARTEEVCRVCARACGRRGGGPLSRVPRFPSNTCGFSCYEPQIGLCMPTIVQATHMSDLESERNDAAVNSQMGVGL